MTEFILIAVPLVTIICILWVRGIDKMNENHPEYKGEDYLDEDF
jgi:hypothetical protein